MAQLGSVRHQSKVEALFYLSPEEEGGRKGALYDGSRLQFYIWTTYVVGTIRLASGTVAQPGVFTELLVELSRPVALELAQRFSAHALHNYNKIGTCIVTKLPTP